MACTSREPAIQRGKLKERFRRRIEAFLLFSDLFPLSLATSFFRSVKRVLWYQAGFMIRVVGF